MTDWQSICLSVALALILVAKTASAAPVSVVVNTQHVAGRTADRLVSFNFDWHKDSEEAPAWIGSSVQVVDLHNPLLRAAAKALSPGHLRIGGSEADEVVYDVDGKGCGTTDPAFCLNMTRWIQLVEFCQDVGCNLVFGLNGMAGRNNNDSAPLNLTNHDQFLSYTATHGLKVFGFELGNELPKVPPSVMAADYLALRRLIDRHWPQQAPLLVGNDLNTNPDYLNAFLPLVNGAINAVTYHNYVGYGLDTNLSKEVVTPDFLDKGPQKAQGVIDAWRNHAPHAEIWAGEIAAAWHSGQDGVTNAFESSIWYADALAALALRNHTGFCRQTLRGGWYGLLNTTTYMPNPDFYTAWLFRTQMGDAAFTVASPEKNLRAYAHCQRDGTGLTLLLINIDPQRPFEVTVPGISLSPRNEYILTAAALNSNVALLNGQALVADRNGTLPQMVPRPVTGTAPLMVPPFSVAYIALPQVQVSACLA